MESEEERLNTIEQAQRLRKGHDGRMIPSSLRITLITAVICYFIIILYFLKQRTLNLKYTLLWLLSGAVMGILVIFPELLTYIIRFLGIESNMNGLFIMCIAFIIMIMMALTSIVSRQNAKIRKLVQEIGILEERVRELDRDKHKGA